MATVRASEKQTVDLSQDRMQGLLQPRLGDQLLNTPDSDEEFGQRKGAWKQFLSTVKNSPEAQQFLITAGLTMASGAGASKGDDFADNLRNSVQSGLKAVGNYANLQEQARQQAFNEDQTAQNNFSERLLQGAQADLAIRQTPGFGDLNASGSGGKSPQELQLELRTQVWKEATEAFPGEDPVSMRNRQAYFDANLARSWEALQQNTWRGGVTPGGTYGIDDQDGNIVEVDAWDANFAEAVSAFETDENPAAVIKLLTEQGSSLDEQTLKAAQEIAALRRAGKKAEADAREKEVRERNLQEEATSKAALILNIETSAKVNAGVPGGQFGFGDGEVGDSWHQTFLTEYEQFQQTEQFKFLPESTKNKLKKQYDTIMKGK